jgi:hypothetical protein
VFPILVHNQCSDFELVSPRYLGNNATWLKSPDQKVDINATIEASFGRDVTKYKCASALLYKLKRKKRFESNDQSNADNPFIEDTSTSPKLLLIWRFTDKSKVSLNAQLIENNDAINWDEDELEELHSMYYSSLEDNRTVRCIRLLDDATVLKITLKWKERIYRTEITVSD